jgi:hypothetical protein
MIRGFFIPLFLLLCIGAHGQGTTLNPITWDVGISGVHHTFGNHEYKVPGNVLVGGSQFPEFSSQNAAQVKIEGKTVKIRNSKFGQHVGQGNTRISPISTAFSMASNLDYSGYAVTSNDVSTVPQFPIMQKIEFGIKLPADVQNEIDLFTIQGPDKRADRAYSAANPNHLGINPYNPEELSFECDITMLCSPTATSAVTKNLVFEGLVSFAGNNYRKFSGRIFGFYYMDAVANSSNSNWQISPAEYPVRFRFAAPCEGYYFFKFRIIRNQGKPNESISEIGGIYQGQPGLNLYPVYCTESGAHAARSRGYIEVGSDKRHFRYSRSKTTYIPTGVNFPELHLFGPTPGNQDLTNEYVYGPKGYERRRNEWMHHLANNSGNCYRIVSMEDNDCVELVTATDPGEPPPFPSTCVPFSINPPGSSTQTADCCEPNANMRWNHLNN